MLGQHELINSDTFMLSSRVLTWKTLLHFAFNNVVLFRKHRFHPFMYAFLYQKRNHRPGFFKDCDMIQL